MKEVRKTRRLAAIVSADVAGFSRMMGADEEGTLDALELNALAIAYRDHGDVALSIPAASEAIRIDPDFLEAHVTLCTNLALSGDEEGAHAVAQQIRTLDPEFRVSTYVTNLPYRDAEMTNRIGDALRATGLED